MSKRTALFPGSFDPITIGHESVIRRALPLFDEIIIAIGVNSAKNYFFPLEKRVAWINQVFHKEPKVRVVNYTGLTIDCCKKENAQYILRGLRTSADYEFERSIAQMNRAMAPEIETVFLQSLPELSAINSTIVRDIIRNGGDVKAFVPSLITIS